MSAPEPSAVPERAQRDEGRPRPQYGEYATPEEQRAHIRQPAASEAIDAGHAPSSVPAGAGAGAVAPAPAPAVAAASGPLSRGRTIDRIATIALLIYGLLNVAVSAPRMFALAEGADGYLGLIGMDEPLADSGAARLWGTIAAVVFIGGWALTAWVSWRMLRRRRVSFWVPIVGAIVFSSLAAVCVLVPALGDPAFLEFAQRLAGTTP